MKFPSNPLVLPVLCLFLIFENAEAVLVAGANGGGNTSNNTTAAQIESQLGIDDASFFNNVLHYSDASAVYIGWSNTISGPRAYALSAMHITFANTMVINGTTYSVTRQSISGSDLALLTLTQVGNIMPSLGAMTLSSTTPSNNTDVLMVGWGRNRAQNASTGANTSDAVAVTSGTGYTTTPTQVVRWGTNQT
ncbi:MAG: hypothetical protein WEB60_02325 [Terrimicrobiaceae bacterium]